MSKNKGLLANRLNQTKGNPSSSQTTPHTASIPPKTDHFQASFQKQESLKDKLQIEVERELSENQIRQEEKKKLEHWKLSTRILNIALVVACIYVLFLIYGVFVTNYQYTEKGVIKPQILSVSDIRDMKEYETVYYQYLHCRSLYEKTLLLDYRLGKGQEDPLIIAPEYEALLEEVTNLSVKTDAMEIDPKYSQIKNMLLSWIKNDIAVYLQNISAAISQNNTDTANKALQDKNRVYGNFSTITQNMIATGNTIKGIDLTTIREWTPEDYVDKEINGK